MRCTYDTERRGIPFLMKIHRAGGVERRMTLSASTPLIPPLSLMRGQGVAVLRVAASLRVRHALSVHPAALQALQPLHHRPWLHGQHQELEPRRPAGHAPQLREHLHQGASWVTGLLNTFTEEELGALDFYIIREGSCDSATTRLPPLCPDTGVTDPTF